MGQESCRFIFPFLLTSFYQGGEEGRTWVRKGMLSMGLMPSPAIFIDMGLVMATGWAIFMGAEEGRLTDAMLRGPVMVTGWWRLTGEVMFTVLVVMFICAAMVTGLLMEMPLLWVVIGAEVLTGVAEAELQTSLLSLLQELKLVCPWVFRWLVM